MSSDTYLRARGDEPPTSVRGRSTTPVPQRPSGFLQSVMASVPRWAPGDSPFHVKGHVYRSSMGLYASIVPGGVAAVLERLDPAHRSFFEQHFLTASWYDALPMLPLSAAAAAALGKPHYEAMRDRASVQVESDAVGVYRVILSMASPEMLVPRLPRAMMQYFDFGEATSAITSPTSCQVTHAGVPMPIVPLGVPLADGFLTTALRLAGANAITFDADPPERDGVAFGTPTYTLRFNVGWRLSRAESPTANRDHST